MAGGTGPILPGLQRPWIVAARVQQGYLRVTSGSLGLARASNYYVIIAYNRVLYALSLVSVVVPSLVSSHVLPARLTSFWEAGCSLAVAGDGDILPTHCTKLHCRSACQVAVYGGVLKSESACSGAQTELLKVQNS